MTSRDERGFTLVELLVVMGILTGFLLMLTQLVDSGLTMFRDGEVGQQLADRTSRVQRVLEAELSRLRGSSVARDREVVDDRLVVQILPIGVPSDPAADATRVQVLRGAVHLDPERELQLMDLRLLPELLQEDPGLEGEELRAKLEEKKQGMPLRGVGNLLLLPWRQEGGDPALLELRAGWFLPGQWLPVGPDDAIDPFTVMVPGTDGFAGIVVYDFTVPILSDLLHCEFLLWSQETTSWGKEPGPLGRFPANPPSTEPLGIWDSARGGWLIDRIGGGAFPFDVGPWSENDVSDDIHPHAIMVRAVVAQPADATPEGVLDGMLGSSDTTLRLYNGSVFPGSSDGGYVKLGTEWIYYGSREGDRLVGLRRGARGTSPKMHEAQTRVHVGSTVEFVVPVLHHKDDWNSVGNFDARD